MFDWVLNTPLNSISCNSLINSWYKGRKKKNWIYIYSREIYICRLERKNVTQEIIFFRNCCFPLELVLMETWTYNLWGLTTYQSFLKNPWFDNYAYSLGRNQETTWFRVKYPCFCKASHSKNSFKSLHTF